jgi:hypothetical protein
MEKPNVKQASPEQSSGDLSLLSTEPNALGIARALPDAEGWEPYYSGAKAPPNTPTQEGNAR